MNINDLTIGQIKPIKEYENVYSASEFGYIISHKRNSAIERILSPSLNSGGYPIVSLCRDGITRTKTVHRLILEAFYQNCSKLEVNHKDGNKKNNSLCNLEWVSSSENKKHGFSIGLYKYSVISKNNLIKGALTLRRKIICTTDNIEFDSLAEAIRGGFAINNSALVQCLQGKTKTHNNKKWKYADAAAAAK